MATRALPPFVPLAGVSWRSLPLFSFLVPLRAVAARFGPPAAVDLESSGLGAFDLWCARFPCGLEAALWLLRLDPGGTGRPITDESEPRCLEVYSNQQEREHLLFHLALEPAEIALGSPDPSTLGPHDWRLLRQDDNGHVFEVGRYSSACQARAMQDDHESRSHKQMYWVDGPGPTPAP